MKKTLYRAGGLFLIAVLCLPLLSYWVNAAGNSIVVDGYELGVSFTSTTSSSMLTDDVTGNTIGFHAEITGSKNWLGPSKKTATITLKNNSGVPVLVYFNANVVLGGNGASLLYSPSFSLSGKTELSLAINESKPIELSAVGQGNTSTVDFFITGIVENTIHNVTLNPSDNCDYSAKDSDGNVISSTGSVSSAKGMTLEIDNVSDGFTCVGFADENGNWVTGVDTAGTASFRPSSPCTISPVLVETSNLPSTAPFKIVRSAGTSHYYLWDSAFAAATLGESVVLAVNEYTLPVILPSYSEPTVLNRAHTRQNGNNIEYLVPLGNILLVPYDADATVTLSEPTVINGYAKPSEFATLNIPDNVSITINGSICVAGSQSSAHSYMGSPTGPLGFIQMEDNSAITINKGGTLYAWGYITGTGTIVAKNGARVYESFQIADWRGGTAASTMINDSNKKTYKVFPVSQYYVQNIEVPLTLEKGSIEYGHTSISMLSGYLTVKTPVIFIGTGGMFVVDSGSITKDYVESTDRMQIDVYGDLTMSSLQLNITASGINYAMNSAEFVLPISNHITVKAWSGNTKITGDLAFLPGSEMYVGENATVTISKDANLYVYDSDDWGKYVYNNVTFKQLAYVAANRNHSTLKGKPVSRTLKDATITVAGKVIATGAHVYTTESGAAIKGEGNGTLIDVTIGTATQTYQVMQGDSNIYYSGVSAPEGQSNPVISITPAKLQHGNGEYLQTGAEENGAGTYYYHEVHQKWVKDGHKPKTEVATNPDFGFCACGEKDYYFQYSNQIGWDKQNTKPWYLKSNLYVMLGGDILTTERLDQLSGYGVYFLKAAPGQTLTNQFVRENAAKIDLKALAEEIEEGEKGDMISAYFGENFSTNDLDSYSVYVLFYIDDNVTGKTYYGSVRERNLKALVASVAEESDEYKTVYEAMTATNQAVAENQSTFSSIPEMPSYMSAAPSAGYFGLNTEAGIAIRQSASVVLIEPWGLRLNGYVSGTFDDYGLVLLNDRDRQFRYEMPTAQQLMAHPDAQVYAASDGSAAVNPGVSIGTGSFTQITTDYIGDLRTYELGNNLYVAFFVRDGENYRFGSVRKHNVYLLCRQALSMDLPETEKAVYLAMIDMFHKVSDYRK